MKDGILLRKNYSKDATETSHQVLTPKHIVTEPLSTLHGETNKHPEITKMIHECQTKPYYPGLAWQIRAWVINCPDFIANKRIDTRQMLSNTKSQWVRKVA